ncbi:hypothetical protein LTR40_014270, partial [Exophiala xenobiotica]
MGPSDPDFQVVAGLRYPEVDETNNIYVSVGIGGWCSLGNLQDCSAYQHNHQRQPNRRYIHQIWRHRRILDILRVGARLQNRYHRHGSWRRPESTSPSHPRDL